MEKTIATLKALGLTTVQARVYLTLARSKDLSIKDIAILSKVPRPDMYRVIRDLEKEGLVEKEIAKPLRFKAIPLREGIETLLQSRNRENSEIQKKAAELLRRQTEKIGVALAKNEESHFLLVPKGRALKRIEQAIDAAQKSVDVALTWNRFSKGSFFLSKKNEKALSRKVNLRIAVEKPAEDVEVSQLELPIDHPHYKIRFISSPPKVILGIYDGKEVSIAENPYAEIDESSLLWSDNRALISLATDYFEILWLTAKEISPEKTGNKPTRMRVLPM